MANDLTFSAAPAYDAIDPRFGTADLGSGVGSTPAGATGSGKVFTWECQIRIAAPPNSLQVFLGAGSTNAAGYLGMDAAGHILGNINTNNTTMASAATYADGAWHHIEMDGTEDGVTLFVDGAPVGSSSAVEDVPAAIVWTVGALESNAAFQWSGFVDEVAFWSIARHAAAFTPPAAAYTGSEAGLTALYHLDGAGTNSAAPDTVPVAATAANLALSPGNWAVDTAAGTLSTINAGAYFSTVFTGASLTLNFDVENLGSPASEIYYRIDGYSAQAPWTKAAVAATVVLAMPADTAALPCHLLEVVVKSTSETLTRWSATSATAVILTGLTLANGAASTLTPPGASRRILFFGDSITEGVRTVNQSTTSDTDRNDAMMGWAYAQRGLLGAEVGIIGFGGTGLTVSGSGVVPALASSFGLVMPGSARVADDGISLVVLNEGTNDSNAVAGAVTSALVTVLNGLVALYPRALIVVMRPFNGSQAAALQTGIAGCASPAQVRYLDTTGFLNTAYGIDSLNLHPAGPNNLAFIAPQVASALGPILNPAPAVFARSYVFS